MTPPPLHFVPVPLAGWLSRHQQEIIEYRQEENRVQRERLGGERFRFTDAQRRRLARGAKRLGRRRLREMSTLVTPDTLLRWYRELVSQKYDGGSKRLPRRPRIEVEIQRLIVRVALENPR
jgi:hypothetical protein